MLCIIQISPAIFVCHKNRSGPVFSPYRIATSFGVEVVLAFYTADYLAIFGYLKPL